MTSRIIQDCSDKSTTDILVSVALIVYNHKLFIEKALNSILMQKVDFKYEIIIGDDCSVDGTIDILKKFKENFPEKINLILSEKNQGVLHNLINIAKQCQGKYIAVLDGDDEWKYDGKLQKQINFLERNPDFSGCFHDAEIHNTNKDNKKHLVNYSTQKYYSQFNLYKEIFYPWDVIHRNIIPSSTLVFVNKNIFDDFSKFKRIYNSCDWLCELLIIKNSKFKYINEIWSIYNNHSKGITKGVSNISLIEENIHILRNLLKDDYYRSIKKDVCYSIARETSYLLHGNDISGINKKRFFKHLYNFIKYKLIAVYYEVVYLIKRYQSSLN